MDILIETYFAEFVAVLTITVLTIITPGPDFFIVARNSLSYSRRSGVFTTLGVATAVWIHIFYTLAGIGLVLSKSILLFSIVKYLGAAYLIYLGWCCIRSNKNDALSIEKTTSNKNVSDFNSFKMGFINNALNPKATLFFMSLFTQVVSHDTPYAIQLVYGSIVSITCLIWFGLVAIFLNQKRVRRIFESVQYYFEKVMGAVLIGFGIKVALISK